MVSTAVSRRQRREAQRRPQQSHRRTLTVIISALTTIALFAGYCAADITDVAPGLLTLKPVTAPFLPIRPPPNQAAPSPVP